ncbi:piggyBac transposable element-derived protein 3-like [Anastrepha obliqua]|uniref:piggyBac transposable element-derived protein 3-like n=1 Tax=Anastrepha obliqua TaxID=95512 RepID=UPI00240A21F1|nr:piggyBac transposable element-derived protein 3-like [Anastrepha obliqua]
MASRDFSRSVRPTDPDFGDRIQRLMANADSDNDSDFSVIDDSDADPDFVISDHEDQVIPGTPSSSESEEDDIVNLHNNVDNIINAVAEGIDHLPEYFLERMKKNETGPPNAWKSDPPPRNVRTPARNIILTRLPAMRPTARSLGNNPEKKEVWKLFFDDDIISKIVTHTNIKLASVRLNLSANTNQSNYRDTDMEEIQALIGLLVLASVLRSNDEKMKSLFTKDECSRPIFRATMSEKHYEILMGSLRFDDAQTRAQRRNDDKAAAISEIFYKIISNSQAAYSPSEFVTVDEMLVPFRGRCAFRVYMPKKPKKYSIKVMCLTDAKTSYLVNAYIYTGKNSDGEGLSEKEQEMPVAVQSLTRLCKVIEGRKRNVTADNWFTSLDGVKQLGKMKLTYVGTVRKDKRTIPEEFQACRRRPVASTLHGFRGEMTLLSFVPKQNRSVCLISTFHHSIETNQNKKKPEVISFYNETKSGVDVLDMKCAVFTSSRKTRRWPLAMFYRLVNIANVNSFIVYMSYSGTQMTTRFEFTKRLAHELIVPHLQKRLEGVVNLPRDLTVDIKKILGDNPDPLPAAGALTDRLEKRKTCGKCPPSSDRKTQHKCFRCNVPICGSCQIRSCFECAAL